MKRLALLALLGTLGCASTKPTTSRAEVRGLVQARGGVRDAVARDSEADVKARIDALLAEPLTDASAVAIALLNNPEFHATLESLGLAQADLVEAGLLDNPAVGGHLVISTAGNGLGGGLGLSQSILSAFLIPAKRRLAKAQVKHAVLTTGDAALHLLRDTKVALADVRAVSRHVLLQRTVVQAAEVADDLAQRQFDAGNLAPFERDHVGTELDEARLELLHHEVELVAARETLNRTLGLWGDDIDWTLAPEGAAGDASIDLAALERRAVAERLDVSAARVEVEAVQRAVELRRRGVVSAVDVGVEAGNEVGNDEGHEWVLGPSLSIELPLFNPGHADFARLRAQLRQADANLRAVAIRARSEVRLRGETLRAAQRARRYVDGTIVPRRASMTQRALEQYNGMLIGAYDLFEARVAEVHAQMEAAEAARAVAIARADLELAVGGTLEG